MAKASRILKQLNKFYSYFAVEFILLLVLFFAVENNIVLRANASSAEKQNRSLFFVYLKNHPNLNNQLVEAYETVNVTLTPLGLPSDKQILASSVKEKETATLTQSRPVAALPTLSGSALQKPNPPTSDGLLPKRDIQVYKVKGGDTLAKIANNYGVSISTIMWENNLSGAEVIRPNQELRILPTDGIKHVVKDGETLEQIAKKYDVDVDTILDYNDEIEIPEYIQPGDEIIIPNGVKKNPPSPKIAKQREEFKIVHVPDNFRTLIGDLLWPLTGVTRVSQGFKKRHPAIDIPCRNCPVLAAADGIVELAGYQKGYGNTIVLNHGSGMKTRYAHGSNLLVSAGDQITKGQVIMISGSTGRSTGPHLHFEIIQNGARLNPLSLIP